MLFAPNRSKRPEDFGQEPASPDVSSLPELDPKCVFCPGNEAYNLDFELFPPGPDWKVRVIPNKYEALGHGGGRQRNDFYSVREGVGDHEVIITRPHNLLTAFLPDDVMDANLLAYQERMRDLSRHPEVHYVHILQNHGKAAGASLLHPHSQIFATPFVPEFIHDEVVRSYVYFEQNGSCAHCQMIMHELKERVRVVSDSEDFLVFAPFASRVPYALRIIPKRHMASFTDMTEAERASLGQVLKDSLQKLFYQLKNPPYNYYIHTLPVSQDLITRYDDRSYHWHLEILPRMNVWGGFELGSEVYVNTIMPEAAADLLRQPPKKD